MAKAYLTCDLRILPGHIPGTYQVSLDSQGATGTCTITSPFQENEMAAWLRQMGYARSTDVLQQEVGLPDLKDLGKKLFYSVFKDTVLVRLKQSMTFCRSKKQGLRIRLKLRNDTPECHDWPWEFLWDDGVFFFSRINRTIVRHIERVDPPNPLTADLPLRILVVVAAPIDLPRLDCKRELTNLKKALAGLEKSNKVQLEVLENATVDRLKAVLDGPNSYHVFHFIGHGEYSQYDNSGRLALEDGSKKTNLILAEQFGALLSSQDSIRLAVINSCEGGRVPVQNPSAAVSISLVNNDIPAVVAMQFPISDSAAIRFTSTFYNSLAKYEPVDAAIAIARNELYTKQVSRIPEWGTPVLYMRSDDGILFKSKNDRKRSSTKSNVNSSRAATVRQSASPSLGRRLIILADAESGIPGLYTLCGKLNRLQPILSFLPQDLRLERGNLKKIQGKYYVNVDSLDRKVEELKKHNGAHFVVVLTKRDVWSEGEFCYVASKSSHAYVSLSSIRGDAKEANRTIEYGVASMVASEYLNARESIIADHARKDFGCFLESPTVPADLMRVGRVPECCRQKIRDKNLVEAIDRILGARYINISSIRKQLQKD